MSATDQWLENIAKQNKWNIEPIAAIIELLQQYPALVEPSIAIADTLLSLNADQDLIEAALFYHLSQNYSANQMAKLTNHTVNKLVVGAHNLAHIETLSQKSKPSREGHDDKMRKMLLAIVDDMRVVVLKLAEQLVCMKSLRDASHIEQQAAAKVVSDIYAPLANRLGIGQLKWQLEDWAFRYNNPNAYQDLKKALNMRRQDREHYVANTIETITRLIEQEKLKDFNINGRAKHIFSIYKKINRKHVDFEEIYDAIALRVLVHSIEDCYKVLSVVHSQWEHIPKEFDDYISNPKDNGYRSIHTAVIGPENKNIEIQIRTYAMHDEAELGVAAHWAYKEGGGSNSSSYDEKITWLQQVMDWQQEVSNQHGELSHNDDEQGNNYQGLFSDRVYVFTPQGDIIDLPEKATPLDFAYYVHSDIGHRCRGAKVNGALVPLTYQLKTGDVVGIQTAKESKPSRDWLNPENGYLQSSKARSKVAHWFRRQNYEENIERGQAIWEKSYRAKNLDKHAPHKVFQRFNFKTVDGLYAALGSGDISMAAMIQQMSQQSSDTAPAEVREPVTRKKPKIKSSRSAKSPINIAGVDNLLSQLAQCCKPIPGDDIVGYITQGRGVTIHRADCHNVLNAQKISPQRMVQTEWGDDIPGGYLVDLTINAIDTDHLVRDLTSIIANEKIPLMGIHSQVNRSDNSASINLTVEIESLAPLHRLIQKIRELPGVTNINRQ